MSAQRASSRASLATRHRAIRAPLATRRLRDVVAAGEDGKVRSISTADAKIVQEFVPGGSTARVPPSVILRDETRGRDFWSGMNQRARKGAACFQPPTNCRAGGAQISAPRRCAVRPPGKFGALRQAQGLAVRQAQALSEVEREPVETAARDGEVGGWKHASPFTPGDSELLCKCGRFMGSGVPGGRRREGTESSRGFARQPSGRRRGGNDL